MRPGIEAALGADDEFSRTLGSAALQLAPGSSDALRLRASRKAALRLRRGGSRPKTRP